MKQTTIQLNTWHGALVISLLALQACQTMPDIADCSQCEPIKQPDSTRSTNSEPNITTKEESVFYRCENAASYAGKIVGDGHCVAFIRNCSNAPLTQYWRPGSWVTESRPPRGAIIATFKNGRYPNKTGYHAAIFIKQDEYGIWVWDQWLGKPVHRRLIKIRDKQSQSVSVPANTAQAYRIVLPAKD